MDCSMHFIKEIYWWALSHPKTKKRWRSVLEPIPRVKTRLLELFFNAMRTVGDLTISQNKDLPSMASHHRFMENALKGLVDLCTS